MAISSGLSGEDCEALINDACNQNKFKAGLATIVGAMYFGPAGLLFTAGFRSKNQIAQELTDQGICSEYIKDKYQIERQVWGLR